MKEILLVDDEFDILFSLELILAEEGYRIRTAHHGRDALDKLENDIPNLIIMDLMMPFLTGMETLKIIRANSLFREIPVVLMSSILPSVLEEEILWNDFLRKPFEMEKLIKIVHKNIGNP